MRAFGSYLRFLPVDEWHLYPNAARRHICEVVSLLFLIVGGLYLVVLMISWVKAACHDSGVRTQVEIMLRDTFIHSTHCHEHVVAFREFLSL